MELHGSVLVKVLDVFFMWRVFVEFGWELDDESASMGGGSIIW